MVMYITREGDYMDFYKHVLENKELIINKTKGLLKIPSVLTEFNPNTTLLLNVFRLGGVAADATVSYINISITELSNF